MPRLITPADAAALKTATRALVQQVGGIDAAEMVTRVAKSRIAEGYAPHVDRLLPIDVIADLERAGGAPTVTGTLARLVGHLLVPLPGGAGGTEARAIAEIGQRSGELFGDWARAMEDGLLSEAERASISSRLAELQRAAAAAIALLAEKQQAAA